jgi:hypothetical protein
VYVSLPLGDRSRYFPRQARPEVGECRDGIEECNWAPEDVL